jgi:Flp pilus assembly protein TadD
MTPEQIEEHNHAFEQAAQLVKGEIITHEHRYAYALSPSARSRLEQAHQLLTRVLELNEENWSAMWFLGKIYQRFGNQLDAFAWFARAHEINSSQPDIAREASVCAMALGRSQEAISYARSALRAKPSSAGLQANLALAFLLGGKLDDAKRAIDRVMADGSSDEISESIRGLIVHFITTGKKPPNTTAELQGYWKQAGS